MATSVEAAALSKTFLDLVKIPSPSFNERAVADYICTRVRKWGYKPVEDKAGKNTGGNSGNIIVSLPATAKKLPALLISAHMDTVEDSDAAPVKPVFEKSTGIFRSNGETILGADDKCGITVMLELLRLLAEEKLPHGELLFVFAIAEECGSHGAHNLDKDLYKGFDAGIILDTWSPRVITVGAPTRVDLHITVHGVGGHAACPEGHINAAQVLARTVGRLPMGRLDEHTTANLGIMWSGTAANIIPEFAYAEYEIRSQREANLDSHLAQILMLIENSVREARIANKDSRKTKEGLKATVDVDLITSFCGYHLKDSAKPVRILEKAITACGLVPKKVIEQGGTDANTYNSRGLPCTVTGCGLREAHSVKESAILEDMVDCTHVLLSAITNEI